MRPQITFADFQKLDLMIGKIIKVEKVENADKLLKIQVDLGEETRQILVGMAEFYSEDELIGKQIVALINLEPRKIRGEESEGMLLAADVDGKPVIISPCEEVPTGSVVR